MQIQYVPPQSSIPPGSTLNVMLVSLYDRITAWYARSVVRVGSEGNSAQGNTGQSPWMLYRSSEVPKMVAFAPKTTSMLDVKLNPLKAREKREERRDKEAVNVMGERNEDDLLPVRVTLIV